jgi:DNA invertase Pin-like site-specific DNA recombinase
LTLSSPFPAGSQLVAYLRDSGGDEQDLSIPQQEQAIRAWCLEHGLILLNLYKDEARQGSSVVERNAFQEMVRWFRSPAAGNTAGIIIWKYSRFARDIDDAQFYKADLRRRGFIIHSLNDTIPEGINGRFFEAAIDWMNQRFLEDLSTDVKRGLRHLVENYHAIPGTPPKGFRREPLQLGQRRDGSPHIVHIWIPDPETWELCRKAWQMRALNLTYRQIHAATGLFSSLNSYQTFFANPIYKGQLRYSDLVILDFYERLVDDATWDKVQALSARNFKHGNNHGPDNLLHPRRKASRFLLSGIVHCARCGSPLNGHAIKFKGQEESNDYYACSKAQRRHECDGRQIPRQVLEQVVVNTLADFLDHPNVILKYQQLQVDFRAHEEDLVLAEKADLKHRLAALQRKMANLTEAIAEQGKAARHLVHKLNDLETQETEMQTELAQVEKSALETPSNLSPIQLSALAAYIQDLYKTAAQDDLRIILAGLIASLTAEREGNLVRGYLQFYLPPSNLDPDLTGKKKFMPMR